MSAFSGELQRNVFGLSSLLNGVETLAAALQIVIVGSRGEAATDRLVKALDGLSLPTAVVSVVSPAAALPPGHPAIGKGQTDGKATAYICRGQSCSLPITEAAALSAALHLR